MAIAMKHGSGVLRIRLTAEQPQQQCEWALLTPGQVSQYGHGALNTLPKHRGAVECVLPAAAVLFTRAVLPVIRRSLNPELLAFATEESMACDPATTAVCRVALTSTGESVLAVVDKAVMVKLRSALAAFGIEEYTVVCETLLLPYEPGIWSLGWNGNEACVRTAEAEGYGTDSGDLTRPPLSLKLLLEAAHLAGSRPVSLLVHADSEEHQPDAAAWSLALGIDVGIGEPWRWYGRADAAAPVLFRQRRHWQHLVAVLPRLRPALWLLAVALGLHASLALQAWGSLSAEKEYLREQMEARFRRAFPDAVAVVDPVLQMRRQLLASRQRTGVPDDGDFLLLLAQIASLGTLPDGSVRRLSYEPGRLTLDLAGLAVDELAHVVARLRQSGLRVELQTIGAEGSDSVLTVRPA